jgi:hypothetical protein
MARHHKKLESNKGAQMTVFNRFIFSAIFFGTMTSHAQDETWQTVSIPGICTYQIPPTVEIQKGMYKEMMTQARQILEISTSPDHVVAQPKGINDFDPIALKRYCRIIVESEKGAKGEYLKLGNRLIASAEELREIDKIFKSGAQQQMAQLTSRGMKSALVSWQPTKIVRINGVDAFLTTYTRIVNDDAPALVRMYMIQNNDAMHTIIISYREAASYLWADDLNRVIGTFKFIKR